jgi:hypothetical protein
MTYDLAILGDPNSEVSALSVDNTAAEGVYKLVQRVLILMFTDVNAQASNGYGTRLPAEVFSANISNKEIIENIMNLAQARVQEQLQDTTADDAPEDEILTEITNTVSTGANSDELFVDITITTASGVDITVSAPVSNIFKTGE